MVLIVIFSFILSEDDDAELFTTDLYLNGTKLLTVLATIKNGKKLNDL